MMYIALTYDHRIVDGKGAVTFLARIKTASRTRSYALEINTPTIRLTSSSSVLALVATSVRSAPANSA